MNDYTHTFTYNNGNVTMLCHFKTDREIAWESQYHAPTTDYYVDVKGVVHATLYREPATVITGDCSFGLKAKLRDNNEPGTHHVTGAYFRHNIDGIVSRQFGIDSNSDQPAGYSIPCEWMGDLVDMDYFDNAYNYHVHTATGVDNDYTGQYNETQGWQALWVLIEQFTGYPTGINDEMGVGQVVEVTLELTIDTNIPIWDSFEHMRAYMQTGSTDGLLNGTEAPSMEDKSRYYIDNLVSNNGNISDIREENYFHFDGHDKCLGFASDDGIHATLYSYNGGPSVIKRSYDRGITYEPVNTYPTNYYVRADLSVPAYVITFNTNIPFFVGDDTDSGKDKLDSYMNGTPAPSGREYSILDAWNRSDIDGTIKGVIGELVENTTNGESSIVYGDGVQMFALTATQKGAFLRDILSGDTMEALVDATKQFGGGAISALQSLRYMPIDASEVCTLSTATTCQIGSYTHTFSSAVDRIQRNDKMINCGQAFFKSPYNDGDFRNLEPWCKMYLALPYAGVHQLAISKYINKRVQIKLAVDITTGACEYHVYANNVEMDSFIGSMGTQIPLTAEDNARQVSGLQNGIIQTVSGLAQIGLSAGATVASGGTLTPVAIAGGVNGANTMAQGLQNMNKEFIDAPIQTKGASVGNLGDFGINSIYFIFAWANSITPKNELNLVGKPSNQGGAVNSFAGFLKCSAFNLADGFAGTQTEAEEISAIMANGVYC